MVRPLRTIGPPAARHPYFLGRGLLSSVGAIVEEFSRGQVVVVTTVPVQKLFGERVVRSFTRAPHVALIPDGEEAKTLRTLDQLTGELLTRGVRRDGTIVALGGGAVGDAAGFAASVYLRGVRLVHVPTTLLAQVDSSIGGKVAVNHERGKNLLGSFHFPAAVIADVRALETLPARELRSGLFEALKAGVIADPELFERIEASWAAMMRGESDLLEEVIRRAVAVKVDIADADPREGDRRRLLNYGHTIAHGIEAAAEYEGITHGDAVGWGMIAANAVARGRGLLSPAEGERVDALIREIGPDPLPCRDREKILDAIGHDKKFTTAGAVMVLPTATGRCEVFEDISAREIERAVDHVLAT